MNVTQVFSLILASALAENLVFAETLGIGLFLRSGGKRSAALWCGGALTGLTTLASVISWAVNALVLTPLGLTELLLAVDVLLIALLEWGLRKWLEVSRSGAAAILRPYGAMLAVNSAVLGTALAVAGRGLSFPEAALWGFFSGAGFMLSSALFTSVRERLEFSECPKAFEGVPIALVTAGLLAMAFLGFSGIRILP